MRTWFEEGYNKMIRVEEGLEDNGLRAVIWSDDDIKDGLAKLL